MSGLPDPPTETPWLLLRHELLAIGARFETAWRQGESPSIEAYLEEAEPTFRTPILHELVAREIRLREEIGTQPSFDEYVRRFPADAESLAAIYGSLSTERTNFGPGIGNSGDEVTDETEAYCSAPDHADGPHGLGQVESAGDMADRRLGRYAVIRLLGKGTFGNVFLAHDEELHRRVAIKVPTLRALGGPGRLEALLAEARLAAGLRHPGIIGVYDVGRDEDGTAFIVLEYVEESMSGATLADMLRRGRMAPALAAELVACVADAVHHAHCTKMVHRDLKPSNIMIDKEGKPRVTDFGLAIVEDFRHDRAGEVAGTPTHMAPEQVRGEAHRLDGRTDVWALGVILYQCLTGRIPFHSPSRAALFDDILLREPTPPRELDPSIPPELERICLRCLRKRMSERYASADDLASELRSWFVDPNSMTMGPGRSSAIPANLVPRGLRAFDWQDSESFVELLPGPRGRDGLPESIRFWKDRIEARDCGPSKSLGLIYGPLGCGKSSLVKAGLLPRLPETFVTVFVEATPHRTEEQLKAALLAKCQELSPDRSLTELLAALRQGLGMPSDRKLLIVFDQFEQWLQANDISQDSELVRALRQCDGNRVHALLVVRDDFWVSVTRLFRMVDAHLSEESNCTAVELLDIHHAESVLVAFGRAFGALPPAPLPLSEDQQSFITQTVDALAQKGQVTQVHLSVLAELVKGREWTPATIQDVGGAQGLGVRFLERAFGAEAPPYRRIHQRAAREVLKRLLPPSRINIKGRARSQTELLAASGYGDRPEEFTELLRVFDSELKLVTPVDHKAIEQGGEAHYQLAHDFLVPALRQWLAAKQRETRSGRAELLLEERAALWGERREPKQLPSLLEWLSISALTARDRWDQSERAVMRTAGRRYLARGAVVTLLMAIAVGTIAWSYGAYQGDALVQRLLVAETSRVPSLVKEFGPYQRWTVPALRAAANNPSLPEQERLHARLALLPKGQVDPQTLVDPLLAAPPGSFRALIEILSPYGPRLAGKLWNVLNSKEETHGRRIRAACALATMDPEEAPWRKSGPDVAAMLLAENPLLVNQWVERLRPVGRFLIDPLESASEGLSDPGTRRLATTILAEYAGDDTERLVDLVINSDPTQFEILLPRLDARREAVIPLLRSRVSGARPLRPGHPGLDPTESDLDRDAREKSTAAVALLRLDEPDALWPLLVFKPDPRVQSETIHALSHFGVPADRIVERFLRETTSSARMALLLALAGRAKADSVNSAVEHLIPTILETYRNDPDPGVHSAARLLLRKIGRIDHARRIDAEFEGQEPRGERRWFVEDGTTMVVVDPIGQDPALSTFRSIDRTFAIATTEVSVAQFLRFRRDHPYSRNLGTDPECPVGKVTWYDAVAYCRWLDEQTGVPEAESCYPAFDQIKEGMQMTAGYLHRRGHRLPTFAEWEFAARGMTKTDRVYGQRLGLMPEYAWFLNDSGGMLHPVGGLKPNAFGLFDVHGNVFEWVQESVAFCHLPGKYDGEELTPVTGNRERSLRSGAITNRGDQIMTWSLGPLAPMTVWDNVGLRIVRTMPEGD
jgi:serine/threonine protein kinase